MNRTHGLRHPFAWLSIFALVLALPALAAQTVAGVQFPETKTVDGRTLQLNGAGLRTRVVQLYAAGLYVENPTQAPQEIITSEQAKRVELHMLRDLTREQVAQTIVQGVAKNAGGQMETLRPRLQQLVDHIPSVQKGETMTLTYVPGKGTTIDGDRISPVTIEGEDFAQAVFSVWLGPDPVQASLKTELSGQA